MNSLSTPRSRMDLVGRLWSRLQSEHTPRDITFDEEGVLAFVGGQHTTHVWFGERVSHDDENQTFTFRVLKTDPTYKKGFHPSPQTGMPEFGKRLLHARYLLGDVVVPQISHPSSLGSALQEIRREFTQQTQNRSLDSGTVNSNRELQNVYQEWFLQAK